MAYIMYPIVTYPMVKPLANTSKTRPWPSFNSTTQYSFYFWPRDTLYLYSIFLFLITVCTGSPSFLGRRILVGL